MLIFLFSCTQSLPTEENNSRYKFNDLIQNPENLILELKNKRIDNAITYSSSFFMGYTVRENLKYAGDTDSKLTELIENHASNFLLTDELAVIEIYIPNLLTANETLLPIFCIGTSLNPSIVNDSLSEFIPGYYVNEFGIFVDTILSSEMALNS